MLAEIAHQIDALDVFVFSAKGTDLFKSPVPGIVIDQDKLAGSIRPFFKFCHYHFHDFFNRGF